MELPLVFLVSNVQRQAIQSGANLPLLNYNGKAHMTLEMLGGAVSQDPNAEPTDSSTSIYNTVCV